LISVIIFGEACKLMKLLIMQYFPVFLYFLLLISNVLPLLKGFRIVGWLLHVMTTDVPRIELHTNSLVVVVYLRAKGNYYTDYDL
jgi:hypothetical protein